MEDDTKREKELTFFSAKYYLVKLHTSMIDVSCTYSIRFRCYGQDMISETTEIGMHPSRMHFLSQVYEFWTVHILLRINKDNNDLLDKSSIGDNRLIIQIPSAKMTKSKIKTHLFACFPRFQNTFYYTCIKLRSESDLSLD